MMHKVHKSAVCLVPSRCVWQQIQEVRCFKDKSFVRWPPHVNLLYPFWEDRGATFSIAARRCSEALQGFSSFQVKLGSLDFFEHGRSCTVWVDPQSEELCRVQAALVEAFPECTDLLDDPRRGITRFTAHLSLGQWRDSRAAAAGVQQCRASWQEVEFEAGAVALISRQGFDDPFMIRYLVGLGGGPVQEVNLPYVSTLGPPSAAQPTQVDQGEGQSRLNDFGLGVWREGIWNFSFGANMSPSKMEGARGLRPLESLPARLPGWRISFTHRGGMGNLVRMAPGDTGPCVHGVLHRLRPADWARLAGMEHEYRPEEVEVERYDGRGTQRAVVFVTPAECCIREGLPPPARYLGLLQEGARHWGLDAGYAEWLGSLSSIDARQRGSEYYSTPGGMPLSALPKIRTGSQQLKQEGGRQGRDGQRRRRPQGRRQQVEGQQVAAGQSLLG